MCFVKMQAYFVNNGYHKLDLCDFSFFLTGPFHGIGEVASKN